MKNLRLLTSWAALALAGAGFSALAQAAPINVLWYSYADPASEYRQTIAQLAGRVMALPQAGGQSWNLTYFGPNGAAPDFAAYDVLVVESGEAFRTNAPGRPYARPDYSGILNNKAAITAARGDRTFLTGSDSDFHMVRGDSGNLAPAKCAPVPTSPDCWDGALGHSVNAINWAANGNGLGVVSFLDGEFPGSFWWTNANSFLHDELNGKVGYGGHDDAPVIDAQAAAYPLNAGLTSQGLSNWGLSFHAFFRDGIPGYTQIVDSSALPSWSLAIATGDFAIAPVAAPLVAVDAPGTLLLVGLGLGLFGLASRRKAGAFAP